VSLPPFRGQFGRQRFALKSGLDLDLRGSPAYPEGMSKKKLRNNGYYLNRLRKEHPAIYDDLEAGRIPSVRQG
jgi:hypothetical protein